MNANAPLFPAESPPVGGNQSLAAESPASGVLPLEVPRLEALVAEALARGDGTRLRSSTHAVMAAEALAGRLEAMAPRSSRVDLVRLGQLLTAVRDALRQAHAGEAL